MRLGPFTFHEPIARGAMGEVWAGAHTDGLPVAIKVLTAEAAREPVFFQAFGTEVRAMASLCHPGVVVVYDYGVIPEALERESGGALKAGCPYLVMEHVAGGALAGKPCPPDFASLRRTLRTLLAALGYAHAQGVVHRDLKPANILVEPDGAVKLVDFGIAHAAQRVEERLVSAGTPEFMAPEQCHGHWRDFGPWTDLYALGCLAFLLSTGVAPFSGQSAFDVMRAQLTNPPPPMDPLFPVPPAFEAWVLRLLEKTPSLRFQRAADAARGLAALGEVTRRPTHAPPEPRAAPASGAVDLIDRDTEVNEPMPAPNSGYQHQPMVEGFGDEVIGAIAANWRRAEPPAPPPLSGAGLGLFGLHTPPMVGRNPERDALWAALLHVADEETRGAIVLRGPAGTGKSRLASWLSERAHALGAATILRAAHSQGADSGEALREMVAAHLRTAALPTDELQQRLEGLLARAGVLEPGELEGLTHLLSDATDTTHTDTGPGDTVQRHLLLARFLVRLAHERPVLVWLDDAQWGLDALAFTQTVLDGAGARPGDPPTQGILFVLTVRDDALAEARAAQRRLSALMDRDGVHSITLKPLSPGAQRALVQGLLPLNPQLTAQVAARTGGNPQFAVQLLRDWVQRKVLLPGHNGFELAAGVTLTLPDDLVEVWAKRVVRLIRRLPPGDAIALEVAAVLGHNVDGSEWRAACAQIGPCECHELRGDLLRQHLATPLPKDGWCFAHGMLREALVRRAQAGGRHQRLHWICAQVLEGRDEARRGRHLVEAGRGQMALAPLAHAVRAKLQGGDYAEAETLLADWERAAKDLPEHDARHGEGLVLHAWIERVRGRVVAAERLAAEAVNTARTRGWRAIEVEARLQQAGIAFERGDLRAGMVLVKRARQGLASDGATGGLLFRLSTEAHARAGEILTRMGRYEEAAQEYTAALSGYQALGEEEMACGVLLKQGMLAKHRGSLHEGVMLVEAARARLEHVGAKAGVADAVHNLGELARLSGEFASAAHHYREALQTYEAMGSAHELFARINLALTLLAQDRLRQAAPYFETCLETAARQGRRVVEIAAHLGLLSCLTAEGNWTRWDAHARMGLSMLGQAEIVDHDLADLVQRAATAAQASGETRRAAPLWKVAATQWRAIGDTARAEACIKTMAQRAPIR